MVKRVIMMLMVMMMMLALAVAPLLDQLIKAIPKSKQRHTQTAYLKTSLIATHSTPAPKFLLLKYFKHQKTKLIY